MIKHLDNYYHYYSTVSLNISTFIFWLLVKVLVGLVISMLRVCKLLDFLITITVINCCYCYMYVMLYVQYIHSILLLLIKRDGLDQGLVDTTLYSCVQKFSPPYLISSELNMRINLSLLVPVF